MLKAFSLKALAAALAGALWWALPPALGLPAAAAVMLATIALFAWHITHPASQFFVPVVSRLGVDAPVVALTFDDGPDPVFTPQILDLLRAHGARATFFVLGARAAAHPELIQRMAAEGHSVGTHTQHHRLRFHFGTAAYVRREIEDANAVVHGILRGRPRWFRPPQGLRTPCFASGFRKLQGLTCVTWSARGLDSRPTTAAAIVARLAPRLLPGAILTLHDGTGLLGGTDRTPTLEALSVLLRTCQERGLRCVALDEVERAP